MQDSRMMLLLPNADFSGISQQLTGRSQPQPEMEPLTGKHIPKRKEG